MQQETKWQKVKPQLAVCLFDKMWLIFLFFLCHYPIKLQTWTVCTSKMNELKFGNRKQETNWQNVNPHLVISLFVV